MTTAAPEQFEALLALQTRDSRAAALREQLRVLQQEPQLVESLKRRRAAVAKAKELDSRRGELEKARDAAHRRVDDLLARLQTERARRDAGGSAKQVSAQTRQIESLTAQVEKARASADTADRELAAFQEERGRLMPRLKAADADARARADEAQEAGRRMRTELTELDARRDELAAGVGNAELVARYERIRGGGTGREKIAAARRQAAACGACGSPLSPAEVSAVEADPQSVAACADCGAILVP
ncbi:zinc ribbon domain-containing protein [Kocuria palustris]|uniref:zinc ribbon domain-containing protein n=1 Tax=Kocuria palustris TaxID=71999 RepID=UPI001642609A|nr:hypothetical protein [Kocuria palustris]